MSPIESTLKHRDVEETLDLLFYRPIGFALTRALAPTPVTPNQVTVASMVVGVVGGHFFLYPGLGLNLLGMALFVLAALLDSVDGQLARLKNMPSRLGRLLDGWSDGLVFTSIYLHLAIRLWREGAGLAIVALAVGAGLSQALQNVMADYYRNAWVAFARPGSHHEMDSREAAERMAAEARDAPWLERALMGFYVGYTARQEVLAPAVARLGRALAPLAASDPRREAARSRYAALCRPFLKLIPWNATNLRMLLLFGAVLAGHPAWFFWMAVVPLNLVWLIIRAGNERGARAALAAIGPVA